MGVSLAIALEVCADNEWIDEKKPMMQRKLNRFFMGLIILISLKLKY